MSYKIAFTLVGFAVFWSGCCQTFTGYGRYTMKVDCDKVELGAETFDVTKRGASLVIDQHTLTRGIYRKTRPWLYVHRIEGDQVDVTFDEGSKPEYPLCTGSSGAISDVYAHPWEMTRSTCASFPNNYWLVSHRWSESGIFFDLHRGTSDVEDWRLREGDIFVSSDGTEVSINAIQTKVKILVFDPSAKTAEVQFTAMP